MRIEMRHAIVEDTDVKLIKTKEGVSCSCGGFAKMTLHFDGERTYGYEYECGCGNHIRVICER